MIRCLCVSGWAETVETVADQFGFWKIADALDAMGCHVVRRAWDELAPLDLYDKDVWISYSYGTAAIEHALDALGPDKVPDQKLAWFIVAGVPRAPWKQSYDLWNAAPADFAMAFNVTSVPVSQGLRNPDGINRINVDCDGRGLNHVNIQDDASVRQTVINHVSLMLEMSNKPDGGA